MKKLLAFIFILTLGHSAFSQPKIDSFSNKFGTPHSKITIWGSGFDTSLSNNIVQFASVRGKVLTASANKLIVETPTSAQYGPILVINLKTNKSCESRLYFTPTFNSPDSIHGSYFKNEIILDGGASSTYKVVINDINADGKPEILIHNFLRNGNASIGIFENQTTKAGQLKVGNKVDIDFGETHVSDFMVRDINGDGYNDLLVAGTTSIKIYLNRKNKTISTAVFPKADIVLGRSQNYNVFGNLAKKVFDVADLDNDGDMDILACEWHTTLGQPGLIRVFQDTGTYYPNYISLPSITSSTNPQAIYLNDFDADEYIDLSVWTSDDPNIKITRNESTPSKGLNLSVYPTAAIWGQPLMGLADIDGDGYMDFIAQHQGQGLYIYENQSGPGSITNGSFFTHTHDFKFKTESFGFSDFNGDGKPDFATVWDNTNPTDTIGVLTFFSNNSSPSTFKITESILNNSLTYPGGQFVTTGDVDLDGKPDIVYTCGEYHKVVVLSNNTPNINSLSIVGDEYLCSGDSIVLKASLSGNFGKSNSLRIELSDTLGSFKNPMVLDSVSVISSFEFKIQIPAYLQPGKYKLRVVSGQPKIISDLESDLIIRKLKPKFSVNKLVLCSNSDTFSFTNLTNENGLAINYIWDFGDGMNQTAKHTKHVFSSADTFHIILTAKYNSCNFVTSQSVISLPTPTALSISSIKNGYCKNDSLELSVAYTSGNSYQWNSTIPNNFGNVSKIFVKNPGIYSCTATNSFGCKTSSSEYQVSEFTNPKVSISVSANFCPDDSVKITSTPNSNYTYFWFKDSIFLLTNHQSFYYVTSAGNYFVAVTDTNDCSASSNERLVTEWPRPNPKIVLRDDSLFANVVFKNYQWFLDGSEILGETYPSLKPYTTGFYQVDVQDSNGCERLSANYKYISSSINNLQSSSTIPIVFPNPSSNNVFAKFSNEQIFDLEIFNTHGQKIQSHSNNSNLIIENLLEGMYFFHFISNGSSQIVKVCIVN